MTVRACGVNARLRAVLSRRVSRLIPITSPHITMLQRFVRAVDLNDVYAAAETVFAERESTTWTLTAIKPTTFLSPPIGLAGIVIEPTEDLLRLQQQLIDAISAHTPLRLEPPTHLPATRTDATSKNL